MNSVIFPLVTNLYLNCISPPIQKSLRNLQPHRKTHGLHSQTTAWRRSCSDASSMLVVCERVQPVGPSAAAADTRGSPFLPLRRNTAESSSVLMSLLPRCWRQESSLWLHASVVEPRKPSRYSSSFSSVIICKTVLRRAAPRFTVGRPGAPGASHSAGTGGGGTECGHRRHSAAAHGRVQHRRQHHDMQTGENTERKHTRTREASVWSDYVGIQITAARIFREANVIGTCTYM